MAGMTTTINKPPRPPKQPQKPKTLPSTTSTSIGKDIKEGLKWIGNIKKNKNKGLDFE